MNAEGGPGERHRTLRTGLASVFILGCFAFQGLAMLDRQIGPIQRAPYLWPFIDYPMYSYARPENSEVERPVVVGVREDGVRVAIEPEDLGLLLFFYRQGPVRAIERGDREAARVFADRYAERHGIVLTGLELRHRPVVVGRDGFRFGPERTVASVSLARELNR